MTDETPNELLLRRVRRLLGKVHELRNPPEHLRRYSRGGEISDLAGELIALEEAVNAVEGVPRETKRQAYESTTRKGPGGQNETRERHESFGLLQFNRVQGRTRLFGSHIEAHDHYITMTLRRANVTHTLSQDWYHTESGFPVVEVALSAAQFAEAISTLNMGSGVPCTITDVEGVRMDPVPDTVAAENEKIRASFKRDIEERVAAVRELYEKVDMLVEAKSSVSKARAREMRDAIGAYLNEIDRDAAFVVRQFGESAERVVTAAKAEIEAMFTHAVHQAGLAHLQLEDGKPALALPPRRSDDPTDGDG